MYIKYKWRNIDFELEGLGSKFFWKDQSPSSDKYNIQLCYISCFSTNYLQDVDWVFMFKEILV